MLAEYGLIPDIFDASSYSSPEVCDLRLRNLKDVLLQRGLVRDFREGEWRAYFSRYEERWDRRARELVRKLITQNRLVTSAPALPQPPQSDVEWCREALASHRSDPLDGVIAGARSGGEFEGESIVSSIERLDAAAWWTPNRDSVRVRRQTQDYLTQLRLILKNANLLMFIDPHLDPQRGNYAEFAQLLISAKRPGECPARIQIHRVCYLGHGAERRVVKPDQWRVAFEGLHQRLVNAELTVDVFIWDDFHDRFLISDIIGILMGNGFDFSKKPNETTTWARISKDDRAKIQREFDPLNPPTRELHGRFTIGKIRR